MMEQNSRLNLYNNLKDIDSSKKREAIIALKSYPDAETISHLEKLFDDSDASIRYFAKKTVNEIKTKLCASTTIEQSVSTNHSREEKPLQISEEYLKKVFVGLGSHEKLKILELIHNNPDSSLLPFIIESIDHEADDNVIATMVKLIGKMGDKSQINVIKKFLDHKNSRITANSVEALDLIGSQETIPLIVPFLNSDDNRVKANAVKALIKFEQFELLKILQKMINSNDQWHCDSAIYALGYIECNESVELLKEFLYKDNEELSKHALKVLYNMKLPLARKYYEEYNNKAVDNKMPAKVKHCPRCKAEHALFAEKCECGYEFTVVKASDLWDAAKSATSKVINSITGNTSEEIKNCPRCNKENNISRKSCGKCGYKFPVIEPQPSALQNNSKNCPECSAKLSSEINCCPDCGYEFPIDNDTALSAVNMSTSDNSNSLDASNEKIKNIVQKSKDVAKESAGFIKNMFINSVKIVSENVPKIVGNFRKCRICGEEIGEKLINNNNSDICDICEIENRIEEEEQIVEKIVNCPECGFELKTSQEPCPECGFKLILSETVIICPECNHCQSINSGKICKNCGFELDEVTACPECGHYQMTSSLNSTQTCKNCGFEINDISTNTAPVDNPPITSGDLNENEKECPFCAEIIKKNAKLCKHCHSKLEE